MTIPNAEDLRDPNAAAITNALNSIATTLEGLNKRLTWLHTDLHAMNATLTQTAHTHYTALRAIDGYLAPR